MGNEREKGSGRCLANKRGKFIVFEGIDGSGISTQTGRLRIFLESEYQIKAIWQRTSEGPVGTLIRQVLCGRLSGVDNNTLALLFAADRIDHNQNKNTPGLGSGRFM
jgi:dTMP kinase